MEFEKSLWKKNRKVWISFQDENNEIKDINCKKILYCGFFDYKFNEECKKLK